MRRRQYGSRLDRRRAATRMYNPPAQAIAQRGLFRPGPLTNLRGSPPRNPPPLSRRNVLLATSQDAV